MDEMTDAEYLLKLAESFETAMEEEEAVRLRGIAHTIESTADKLERVYEWAATLSLSHRHLVPEDIIPPIEVKE